MNATISAWFYKHLAGIRVNEEMHGFQKFILKPYLPEKLQSVGAMVYMVKGFVRLSWSKKFYEIILNMCIPFDN